MTRPAVLALSDDPTWLADAAEAVVLAGGVVVAECADAVSVLALAALDLADVVLVDPSVLDLDRKVVVSLRRRGLDVVVVSSSIHISIPAGLSCFDDFGAALAWAANRSALGAADREATSCPIVAVFGTRGAPGASTLAVALALRAAGTPSAPIALLDLDARGGVAARLLDLGEDASVLSAADAMAHDEPWMPGASMQGLTVFGAPSRPWHDEVAPAEIGLLLDSVGADRTTIIDAGTAQVRVDDIGDVILTRATHVVLVGRADRVALPHLLETAAWLRPRTYALTIVVNQWRGGATRARIRRELRSLGVADHVRFVPQASAVEPLVEVLFSGAEEQHQSGRGVQQHEDRHRHAGARPRLRLRARRDD